MTRDIEIDKVRPDPNQPRDEFDEEKLEELAQSMKAGGQAVPITVRPEEGSEEHVIISGERRWRAAQRLGWDTITADVQDIPEEEARWRSVIENVQREDLAATEEARAYARLLQRQGLTQEELGDKIGKSQSYIARKLRLLDIPPPVICWLEAGHLTEGHLRQLMRLKGFYLDGATVGYRDDLPQQAESPCEATFLFLGEKPMDWALRDPLRGSLEDEGFLENQEHLQGAANRFLEYAHEGNRTVPAWARGAWYYGGVAHGKELTVSKLASAVDELETLIRSHYVYLTSSRMGELVSNGPSVRYAPKTEGAPPPGPKVGTPVSELTREEVRSVLDRLHYWGAWADLGHAGLLSVLEATYDGHFDSDGQSAESDPGAGTDLSAEQVEANWEVVEESIEKFREDETFLLPTMMLHSKAPAFEKRRQLEARLSDLGGVR